MFSDICDSILATNSKGENLVGTDPIGANPTGINPDGTKPLGTNTLGTCPLGSASGCISPTNTGGPYANTSLVYLSHTLTLSRTSSLTVPSLPTGLDHSDHSDHQEISNAAGHDSAVENASHNDEAASTPARTGVVGLSAKSSTPVSAALADSIMTSIPSVNTNAPTSEIEENSDDTTEGDSPHNSDSPPATTSLPTGSPDEGTNDSPGDTTNRFPTPSTYIAGNNDSNNDSATPSVSNGISRNMYTDVGNEANGAGASSPVGPSASPQSSDMGSGDRDSKPDGANNTVAGANAQGNFSNNAESLVGAQMPTGGCPASPSAVTVTISALQTVTVTASGIGDQALPSFPSGNTMTLPETAGYILPTGVADVPPYPVLQNSTSLGTGMETASRPTGKMYISTENRSWHTRISTASAASQSIDSRDTEWRKRYF